MTKSRTSLVAAALSGLLASACTSPEHPGNARVQPEYDKSGRLTKLSYDRDGDGKIETWGYMDGTRVVRVEADEDGDDQIDRWEFYKDPAGSTGSTGTTGSATSTGWRGASGSSPNLLLERVERAKHQDGKVSRKEYFENGVLARVEEDTDGNGTNDKWETYISGTLAIMALDTSGRGSADRRLIYKPDGSFDHVETDPTGSDTFQAVKR